jgi:dihydrolipoamide dehydrogenase
METNVPGIFAAGDVTMEHTWTHVAYAQGIVAAENAMGVNSTVDYSVVPFCANTIPEVAGVGLTEDAAIAAGHKIKVGRFPFAANAAATIMGQRTGTMKMVTEEKYGQILGAHATGPQAAGLISEVALAMKLEATPREIASLMHGHPTLSEICWESARDVLGEAIHFMKG